LLERPVALKLLHSSVGDDHTLSEARLLAKVRHPNVVTVYGVDQADGRIGVWMELLTGRSLKDEVSGKGPLPERDAAIIGADLCRGLAAAHGVSLVHGDVKAQNVIREQDGRVVLTDFGAGVNHDATAERAPALGGGTPCYMAPELFEGRSISVRSDVYSVGVLLFYLVTGQYPVLADSYAGLVEAHRAGRRKRLREVKPEVSIAFAEVVDRALAASPGDRYGSALELEGALHASLRRDDARHNRRRVMAWTAVIAVVLSAAVGTALWRSPLGGAGSVKSIAVLPFANLSGNADDEYLADGMTDLLTASLAQLNALRVTSRTSAMRYKNTRDAMPSIGAALHADALVEGSIVRANGRVRVTAQVIRANTDEHVWSQTFERHDEDVLALQTELASAIAGAIKLAVTPSARQRVSAPHPIKPAAQDAYLRARYLIDQYSADNAHQALALLKTAVDTDPSYARAFAALARLYVIIESYGQMPHADAYAAAYEAATRAIALDDELPEAHSELADILLNDRWDWGAAEREYQRAIDLNHANTLARSHYSRFLSAVGRHDEAFDQARLALDGDPLSAEALNSLPIAQYYAGRYSEAIAGYHTALNALPDSASSHFGLGRALSASGDFVGAEREIREAVRLTKSSAVYTLELARTVAAAGRRDQGFELVRGIEPADNPGVLSAYLGYIYAALGDSDQAFVHLDQSVRERWPGLLWAKVDPRLDSLRQDRRFPLLLQALGVPK
jgi:TolB-like protein